jgi:hypothetical protein
MKTKMIVALTTVFLLAGCACVTTEYKVFEGVQDGIIDGKGGTKVVEDGMEIWDDGEPPRKFKVIGFIDDTRVAGWMHMLSLRDDIVEKAREAGGDAIIKMNAQSQLIRLYSAAGASVNVYGNYAPTSTAYASPEKSVSKYAVIKYMK